MLAKCFRDCADTAHVGFPVQGEPKYAALGVLFFLLLTFFCRFLLFNLWYSYALQLLD